MKESGTEVTVVKCITPNIDKLPPCVILQGRTHLERWCRETIPNKYRVAIFETGWTDNVLIGLNFCWKKTRKRAPVAKTAFSSWFAP